MVEALLKLHANSNHVSFLSWRLFWDCYLTHEDHILRGIWCHCWSYLAKRQSHSQCYPCVSRLFGGSWSSRVVVKPARDSHCEQRPTMVTSLKPAPLPEEPRSPWLASKFQGSHGGQLGAMHYDIGLLCCMPSDQVFQWLKHIMSGTHFISACAQNVHEASVSKPSGKRPCMEFLCCRQCFGTHLFCSPVSWEAYWWCSRPA